MARIDATWVGRAIEAAASTIALVAVVAYARRVGVDGRMVAWMLVAASPLVGEFAMTMAYRYRPDMDLGAAAGRFLAPSRCDSCLKTLSQWDILPVVPYVVRGGRCSCRRFRVPADCTIVGLLTLAGSIAILAASTLGFDPVRPMAIFLSFVPALVADALHGEVDEPLFAFPAVVGLFFLPSPLWMGPAMAALLVLNAYLSALLVKLAGRRDELSVGMADLLALAALGLFLGFQDAVNATCWFVAGLGLTHAVAFAMRRRSRLVPAFPGVYGPNPGSESGNPVPALPAVVLSGVLGATWHLWA